MAAKPTSMPPNFVNRGQEVYNPIKVKKFITLEDEDSFIIIVSQKQKKFY